MQFLVDHWQWIVVIFTFGGFVAIAKQDSIALKSIKKSMVTTETCNERTKTCQESTGKSLNKLSTDVAEIKVIQNKQLIFMGRVEEHMRAQNARSREHS